MRFTTSLRPLLVVCLTLTFVSCKRTGPAGANTVSGDGGSSAPTQSPGPGGSVTGGGVGGAGGVVSSSDEPREALIKSMHATLNAKSFRVRMETSTQGRTLNSLMEYVAPDRLHVKSDMQEIIAVGPNAYQKIGGGPWQKLPMDVSKLMAAFRDPKLEEAIRKSADAKFVGTETLDGKPMLVYQYSIDNFQGMPLKATSKSWISPEDGLPRKVESEGEMNGIKSKSVITYYDFGADIRIEPPAQ